MILVVDDNPSNLKLVAALLREERYQVELCDSGERALEWFVTRRPDIVLLDIRMPGIDGFETSRRLRQLPGGSDVPIVFLTALADLGTHQIAMESGADDYLTKPINRTELLLRVRSLLRISRMSGELRSSHELIAGKNDELLRVQRRKDDLAAFIVHDLRNPLSSIIANVDSVISSPASVEDTLEVLRDVQMASDDLRRMISNLLDVGRSEDGELVVDRRPTDIARLVERAVGGMRAKLEDRRLNLANEVSNCSLSADETLLRRVIDNLVDNCIHFAPPGSTVTVRCRCEEDEVELRVSDEGAGVPDAERDRVFDKYVQLDSGNNLTRTGRGLGLTFCKLVVLAHGGTIANEPNVPHGTVFVVRLPRQAAR